MSLLDEHAVSVMRPAGSPRWRRWLILVLLALSAVIGFIDRTNIAAVLAAPGFRRSLALSDLDRGTLASGFFWTYAALQIPMGWIVDRYGVKWPYAISFALWCLASAGTGLMSGYDGLLAMRLLTGLGEAIVVPATYRWIRFNFADSNSGTAVGFYMLGTKVGPAIGAPLAAWLITRHDWRTMFLVTGLAGLVWLVPWLAFATDDAGLRTRHAVVATSGVAVPAGIGFGVILRNPMIWGTIVITFCYNYFVFYSMTWMPAYLVEQHGLSLRSSGLYSFYSFLGIALVTILAGWAGDKLVQRDMDAVLVRKAFVVAGFLLASTELFGVSASGVGMAVFWNIVSLSGLGLASANNLALCRLTLIPAPAVGLVTGIQNVATALAGIVAPILTGWLLQRSGSYDAPMEAIFLCLVVGAGSCILLVRRHLAPVLPG